MNLFESVSNMSRFGQMLGRAVFSRAFNRVLASQSTSILLYINMLMVVEVRVHPLVTSWRTIGLIIIALACIQVTDYDFIDQELEEKMELI